MATRTIADGGGNYNTGGTWVEGVAPTASDDVVATATSGNLTLTVNGSCRSIDLTGYAGTLTINSNISLNVGTSTVNGSGVALLLPSSCNVVVGNTLSAINFNSTSGTLQTIDFGGKTVGKVAFTNAGSNYKLNSDVNTGSAGFTVFAGTVDFNSKTITCAGLSWGVTGAVNISCGAATFNCTTFNLSGSSAHTVNLDSAAINASGSLFTLSASSVTWNPGTSTVTLTGNTVTLQVMNAALTLYNLVANTEGGTVKFIDGSTTTATHSVTFQNVTLQGTSTGGWTIAMPATQTIDHVTVSYSTATGNTAVAGTGSIDAGNNVNWNFGNSTSNLSQLIGGKCI